MAKATPPDRERIRSRIARIEQKLAKPPRDGTSTEASIEHAAAQITYWTLRQMLASADIRAAQEIDDSDLKVSLLRLHYLESRKCTEMAAEWERRKADSGKLMIGRELKRLEQKLEETMRAGSGMRGIETD